MRVLDTLSVQDNCDDGRPQIATIATSIWAFTTLIWSLVTPPHFTFPARVVLLQPTWILRVFLDDETWVQDLCIFLVLHAGFTLYTGAWSLPRITGWASLRIVSELVWIYLRIFSLLAAFCALAAAIVIRGKQLSDAETKPAESTHVIEENPIPPLLIPSRTTHTRFVPKKHSFGYSYLFVGIPIGPSGRFGRALSVDSAKRGWFDVKGADYLMRSEGSKTLVQKLHAYLKTQGISSQDYEFAYLVTAPRFLGYSFNPVSFWYLYDEDINLKYMILEVNNTFDERRMYLLKPGKRNDCNDSSDRKDHSDHTTLFTQTWEKDFHVSPFNSRLGSYSLRAVDPSAASDKSGFPAFDNAITLRSSKGEAKIVARVWSTGKPLEPEALSSLMLLRFITNWWWVGLVTFPRIVWQAQKLFLSKKLIVYFRPEVSDLSIGRTYTLDERYLEAFFRAFIAETVENSQEPLRLIYEPPHGEGEIVFYSPRFTYEEDHKTTLTLKVLTPAFYSRFVHYAHSQEAFDRECLATDEKNRTATLDPPGLITALLAAMKQPGAGDVTTKGSMLSIDRLRWRLLARLRCPPAEASYPSSKGNHEAAGLQDIRSFGPSELDSFVRSQCEDAEVYAGIVTKIFIAQRYFVGMPVVLTLLDWFMRASMLLTAIIYINSCQHFDILRPRPHTRDDIIPVALMLGLANIVHIWAFFTAQT